tara:strand:- start:17376 stop:18476 length:1101 start_codon:yes stop_codon:yes gene_type:complete
MTYQDEFARRLGQRAGDGKAAGGPSTGSERTDEGERRHPEPVSGPRAARPEDRGKTDGVLRRAQDDDEGRVQDNGDYNSVSGEPVEPRFSDEKRLSESQTARSATGSGLTDQDDTTPTRTPRHDGWLPETRVKFLEALARTGNVQASAYYVQLSRQSAYDLRRRDPDFARAWRAALVLARDVAEDALQERAIEGIEEPVYYHGEVVGMRRRYDSRLLLAHLARLDKIAEEIPAQRGAARFEEMLEAIRTGADTAPLIATPTDEELATAAARAEAPPPAEEEGDEFYAVHWPAEEDRPVDYYRMTPEEAAAMAREVPGLVAIPTGTRNGALATAMHIEELARAEAAEKAAGDDPWPEEGDGAGGLRI